MAATVSQRKLSCTLISFKNILFYLSRCRMQSGCNSFLVDPSSSACYTGALTDQQISDSTSAAVAPPANGEAELYLVVESTVGN